MGKKVVVAGHVCMDITLPLGSERVSDIGQVLRPGKLFSIGGAAVNTGGVVANTGLAMKFFGADVALAGKIGNDSFGDMVTAGFAHWNAENHLIRREGETTSYTVVLTVPGIDRIFLTHPGANDTFSAEDLSDELLKDAALFHFGYPPLMRRMYRENGDGLAAVFKRAKSAGAVTSMDLAMVDPDSDAGRADWESILKKVLPYVDIFVPSVEELCFMLERESFEKLQKKAGSRDLCEFIDVDSILRPLAERCLELGAKIVLIKCGTLGMYYKTASAGQISQISQRLALDTAAWGEKEGFEASYVPEQLLSGTGAGDTSIAAFLVSLLNGCPPEMCVRYAAATGACCVSAYDALSGLKSFAELDQKIQNGWAKQATRGGFKCW